MEITQEQQHHLDAIGQKYNLKLILLHGSFATGKQHPGSDLDVAFLGKKPLEFQRELQLASDLANIFGNSKERELDVKSLHRADPLFLHEVARDSHLLYGNVTDYSEFRAYVFRVHMDSKDLRELEYLQTKKLLGRLTAKYA